MTDTRNAASIVVAERLGMALVATVHTTFKGEACDEHTYEIDREAWESAASVNSRYLRLCSTARL